MEDLLSISLLQKGRRSVYLGLGCTGLYCTVLLLLAAVLLLNDSISWLSGFWRLKEQVCDCAAECTREKGTFIEHHTQR